MRFASQCCPIYHSVSALGSSMLLVVRWEEERDYPVAWHNRTRCVSKRSTTTTTSKVIQERMICHTCNVKCHPIHPNTFETILLFNIIIIIKGRYINVGLLFVSFFLHLFLLQMYTHLLSWLIIIASVSNAVKSAWIEKYKPNLYQFQIAPLETSLIHDCSKVPLSFSFSSSSLIIVSI